LGTVEDQGAGGGVLLFIDGRIRSPVLLSIGQSEPFTATSVIAEERGPA
jgi:hypothetical protein